MHKFLIVSLFSLQFAYTAEPLEKYFSYIQQLERPTGSYQNGEIELVLEPAKISEIEKVQETRLLKKGFSPADAHDFSHIGIVSEDQYWIWLRDAVYFPKGTSGTYDRLVPRTALRSPSPGVAVLPVLPSGHIVLNLNYRHAMRSWELELPRGGKDGDESDEETALRELKEETGMEVSSLTFLGKLATDTGMIDSVVPIYLGSVSSQGLSDQEESEAIDGTLAFTKEELRQGLIQGYLEVSLHNKKEKIPLRDAFFAFAFLQAELRGLLQ